MTTIVSVPNSISENQLLDAPVTSNPQSLSAALNARRSDYTISEQVRIKIGSWNIAGCPEAENDLRAWFVENRKLSTASTDSSGKRSSIGQNLASEKHLREASPFGRNSMDGEDVDIYVLGLQEVMSLNGPKQYMGMVQPVLGYLSRWRNALADALPQGYVQISEQQLSGLLLFIYASPSTAPKISSVSSVRVGTGIMGYLGNKGAIVTRILLGETTRIVFVNSHLTSGAHPVNLERRLWDVDQILQRAIFEPINQPGIPLESQERIGDEEFGFWFGDLNFRLEKLPGDEIRRLLTLHAKGEYSIDLQKDTYPDEVEDKTFIIHSESDEEYDPNLPESELSIKYEKTEDLSPTFLDSDEFTRRLGEDPASLQATLNSLLPHDQLKLAQKHERAFHDGWHEGKISFLPTYKYDIGGEGAFDTSEKRRAPSWCDRVLYRTRRDKLAHDEKFKKGSAASTGDDAGPKSNLHAENTRDVLFDYDPDQDGAEVLETINDDTFGDDTENDGLYEDNRLDKIKLELYTSHQWVVSSDHKPVVATFTLEYDVVAPELKAKVYQEVARRLDRAENERRPGITVVIDHSMDETSTESLRDVSDAVDFGTAAYKSRKIRYLTIANTSQVHATVTLVERNNFQGISATNFPRWLSFYFIDLEANHEHHVRNSAEASVTLEPGDSISLALEVCVEDIELVRALNEKSCKLEDVLILRVSGGRDHFIPLRGIWLPSCLGRSIDQLIRIPRGGVRALSMEENDDDTRMQRQEIQWSAPRELFKLTEALHSITERVVAESNILDETGIPIDAPGWPFSPKYWVLKDKQKRDEYKHLIFDALDTDNDLTEVFTPDISAIERLEIMSEVLLDFLSSLKDGIVTESLWEDLEQNYANRGSSTDEIKAWALDILSAAPYHSISFVFLTTMLAQMVAELAPFYRSTKLNEKNGIDNIIRKSWGWKAEVSVPGPLGLALRQRILVEKAIAELFVPVLFRHVEGVKERERKSMEEKQKAILQEFLKSIEIQNG